ncbi:hypothetical protein AAFF_G00321050 [Aldrovandia affinis]|uniref:Adhesion G protein-coupled receptor G7 n=1 Tax=Aldrovandia affinis TaxID=143900 RepID=A0AAD7R7K3_9TELE|nr:hypothetical protein AAFF_G00321050 [Aldrovandia affinis]
MCVCPDEWTGETCEKPGLPQASARCVNTSGSVHFEEPQIVDCGLTLSDLIANMSSSSNLKEIATYTQILTSNPEKLTSEDITTAAEITEKLLNKNSSELLNANDDKFSPQNSKAMQRYSTSGGFVSSRVHLNTNATELTGNNINSTGPSMNIFIQLPPGGLRTDTNIGFVLYQNDKFFRSKAFTSSLGTNRIVISASLGGSSRTERVVAERVEMVFQPPSVPNVTLYDYACVFWNYTLEDWSTFGCVKTNSTPGTLGCSCNHTTNYAMLMSYRKDFKYSKALDWITDVGCALSIIFLGLTIMVELIISKPRTSSTVILVSCCLSLLIFNVLFLTGSNNSEPEREDRSTNVIPPSDKQVDRDSGHCTFVTALMHYFLLATFAWNTLYATQLLMANLKMNRLSQRGKASQRIPIVITLATGWGCPLVVVSITLAATYRVDNPLNYRQEEFCWLASVDESGKFDISKPMLWSFLLPIGLVLIFNAGELVFWAITTAKQTQQRANSLKKDRIKNTLKKFLSSLSLAALLGVSWLLGYVMLMTHDNNSFHILSIIFCLFNTTQGLQIFFLFPEWRKIIARARSVKAPSISISLHSMTYHFRAGSDIIETRESYKRMETDLTSSLQSLPLPLYSDQDPKEREVGSTTGESEARGGVMI